MRALDMRVKRRACASLPQFEYRDFGSLVSLGESRPRRQPHRRHRQPDFCPWADRTPDVCVALPTTCGYVTRLGSNGPRHARTSIASFDGTTSEASLAGGHAISNRADIAGWVRGNLQRAGRRNKGSCEQQTHIAT